MSSLNSMNSDSIMTPPICKRPPEREMPEYDPVFVAELMNEARARIQRLANMAPGVWVWAREHRADKLATVEKRKAEFKMACAARDLPSCYKWIYAFEQAVKGIIKDYMAISAKIAISAKAA